MATLPVPQADTDRMIAIVGTWIDRVAKCLSDEGGRAWIERTLLARLKQGRTERQKVIAEAEAGDVVSHDVLMAEFHDLLDNHQLPPVSLCAYARATDKHPKRKAGGYIWADHWVGNYGVSILVYLASEVFELRPTRSRDARRKSLYPSGASLVAAALGRRGIASFDERRVENIWRDHHSVVVPEIARWRRELLRRQVVGVRSTFGWFTSIRVMNER
jgi:hypothetical protein